jgi:methionyl-tRNA formyltransferase
MSAAKGPPYATRVVFLGSGAFAVPSLDALLSMPDIDVVGVVSAPDRPVGRRGLVTPTPVTSRALDSGLPVLRPDRLRAPEAVAAVADLAPDLGVLADYGQIVPPILLDRPSHGILNVHPSLLPRHRGATPIAAAILAGDAETGVTIIRMDAGLDTGPIVAVDRWTLRGDETAPELEGTAAARGAQLLIATMPRWLAGAAHPMPQDEAAATLTRPFRREDGRLDGSVPAAVLERRVRALMPWPGTFLETASGRLVIERASLAAAREDDRPGRIVADGDGLALATVDGRLQLLAVRAAGGRSMTGADHRRGAGRRLVGTDVHAAADPPDA